MTLKDKLKWAMVAWVINGIFCLIVWFGGDVLLHEGYDYLKDSIHAFRVAASTSKLALSLGILIGITELKKDGVI